MENTFYFNEDHKALQFGWTEIDVLVLHNTTFELFESQDVIIRISNISLIHMMNVVDNVLTGEEGVACVGLLGWKLRQEIGTDKKSNNLPAIAVI